MLGADVDVFDFLTRLEHEVAGLARVAELGDNAALFVETHVGLRDDVLVFFPRREIFAVGFEFGGLLLAAELPVGIVRVGALHNVADFVIGLAGIENANFVDHHALDHFAIRALDEAVFVDARKAARATK